MSDRAVSVAKVNDSLTRDADVEPVHWEEILWL